MLMDNIKYRKRILQLENEIKNFQAAVSELKILNEIAVDAGRTEDVNETLKLILTKTTSAVNAEHGAILLVSENNEVMETFIKKAKNSKVNERPHIGDHITGWVLLNKKSLIIKDLSTEIRFKVTTEESRDIKSLICSPIWSEGKIIGILQMINKKTNQNEQVTFTDNDLTLLSIISVQAGQLIKNVGLQQSNFEKKQEAEYSRLRAEKAELLAKQMEAEKEFNEQKIRTHIAADLHDQIASNLSSISMFSKIIQEELVNNKTEAARFLERISEISQESICSIRDIIWAIDSKPESIYDIILRLRDSYICIFQAKGIKLNFNVPSKENLPQNNLSPEQRKNIWSILKEAVNNAVKYSSCTELNLTLKVSSYNKNTININIVDNGIGFDSSLEHNGKGIGIMKNRAQNIGAELIINSHINKGSILQLSFKID